MLPETRQAARMPGTWPCAKPGTTVLSQYAKSLRGVPWHRLTSRFSAMETGKALRHAAWAGDKPGSRVTVAAGPVDLPGRQLKQGQ